MVAQRTVNPWPMAWRFESSPVQFYMWTLAERSNALDCGSRVHQFESGTPTFMVPWCNGSTSDFLSENEGSTPLGTKFAEGFQLQVE